MSSLFESLLVGGTLRDLADSWGVGPEQAARRLRRVPFVMLNHTDVRGGGRGRPARRLALDPNWHFWASAGDRPLGLLLDHLRTLHDLGERFALGVPLTSVHWRPFLHPEVRVLAPVETISLWNRLFAGTSGGLAVVVDLFPDSADVVELEGLPVLGPSDATVDALLGYERLQNANLLALADSLAHNTDLGPAQSFASSRGLDRDLAYLTDHRRWRGARVLHPPQVREAHQLAEETSSAPPATRFSELLEREVVASDRASSR